MNYEILDVFKSVEDRLTCNTQTNHLDSLQSGILVKFPKQLLVLFILPLLLNILLFLPAETQSQTLPANHKAIW